MRLHTNMAQRVVVDTRCAAWVPSPQPGVERIMLERDGGEVARATSLVRYAAGARFPHHHHELGEELLVLSGEFCDEHGRYPRGTYVRNPWGSTHAPFSEVGCLIFVRLRQIPTAQEPRMVQRDAPLVSAHQEWVRHTLYQSEAEHVLVEAWPAGFCPDEPMPTRIQEIFVLEGSFEDERGTCGAGTWLRQPVGSTHHPGTSTGCVLYIRRGLPP